MATEGMTPEIYDTILDALDNEDIELLQQLFMENDLTPYSPLFDAPRISNPGDIELLTYIDYVLHYNLTDIIDFLVDEMDFEITDQIMARSLELQNPDTFDYILEMGYIPEMGSAKYATRHCYPTQLDNILTLDGDLVNYLDDEDIEYLFSFDMNEDTIETIRVLFNYGVDKMLFTRFLKALKDPEDKYFNVSEDEQDLAIEIIEFLESNGVIDI